MIGGSDTIIENPTRSSAQALDLASRCLRNAWPNVEFHDGDGRLLGNYEQIAFGTVSELFAFRDREAAERWSHLGADPSNVNQMVHLLADVSSLTVVVDDQNHAEMKRVLSAVRNGMQSLQWKLVA